MNALETNAANAVIDRLGGAPLLGAIPPRLWDSDEDATIPRLSVKVTQGVELIYRFGVYRMSCELRIVVEVSDNRLDEITEAIRRLMTDDQNAHTAITNNHFFCFAVESLNSSVATVAGKKRVRTISVNLVGFDLDRFN